MVEMASGEAMATWLPIIWIGLLGTAVALYVVLDGFDLGIGILFPFSPEEDDRDVMMNSVAPFWDGNETWLILGGGGLFVAFPLAYGIIMSGFYLPVIIMLLALVFRGVAFEYRWVAKPSHSSWDIAFAGGSITAAFMQGVILGGLLHGLPVKDGHFAGGMLDWLQPFPLFVGFATVAGYALLGATWLVMRTTGEVAAQAREQARGLLFVVLAAMVIVSLWTPLSSDRIWDRWFTLPNFIYLSPIPILTAICALTVWRGLVNGHDNAPFFGTVATLPARLCGPCNLHAALSRPTHSHDLGCGRSSLFATLHVDWNSSLPTPHSWIHRVRLLDVSRQSKTRRGLSLTSPGKLQPMAVMSGRIHMRHGKRQVLVRGLLGTVSRRRSAIERDGRCFFSGDAENLLVLRDGAGWPRSNVRDADHIIHAERSMTG